MTYVFHVLQMFFHFWLSEVMFHMPIMLAVKESRHRILKHRNVISKTHKQTDRQTDRQVWSPHFPWLGGELQLRIEHQRQWIPSNNLQAGWRPCVVSWINCVFMVRLSEKSNIHYCRELCHRYTNTEDRPDIVVFDTQSGSTIDLDISLTHPWSSETFPNSAYTNGAVALRRKEKNGRSTIQRRDQAAPLWDWYLLSSSTLEDGE